MGTGIVQHKGKGLHNPQPYMSFFSFILANTFFVPLTEKLVLFYMSTWSGFAEKFPQIKCSSLTVKYK